MAPNNEPLRTKKRKSSDQNRAGPSRKKSKTLVEKAGSGVATTALSTPANKNPIAENLKGKGKGKEKESGVQGLLPVQPTQMEGPGGPGGSVGGPDTTDESQTINFSPSQPQPLPPPTPSPPHPLLPNPHPYIRLAPAKPPSSMTLTNRPPGSSTTAPKAGIKERGVLFVTKKTPLGAYLRRCRGLLVDEGLPRITLHALSAAIPHAIHILHSLIEILPFPKGTVGHELISRQVRCFDERRSGQGWGGLKNRATTTTRTPALDGPSGTSGMVTDDAPTLRVQEVGDEWTAELFEDDEEGIRVRIKSAIQINITIGPTGRVGQGDVGRDKDGKDSRAPKAKVAKGKGGKGEKGEGRKNKPSEGGDPLITSNTNTTTNPTTTDTNTTSTSTHPNPTSLGKKKNRPSKSVRMARRRAALVVVGDTGVGGQDGNSGKQDGKKNESTNKKKKKEGSSVTATRVPLGEEEEDEEERMNGVVMASAV